MKTLSTFYAATRRGGYRFFSFLLQQQWQLSFSIDFFFIHATHPHYHTIPLSFKLNWMASTLLAAASRERAKCRTIKYAVDVLGAIGFIICLLKHYVRLALCNASFFVINCWCRSSPCSIALTWLLLLLRCICECVPTALRLVHKNTIIRINMLQRECNHHWVNLPRRILQNIYDILCVYIREKWRCDERGGFFFCKIYTMQIYVVRFFFVIILPDF